MDSNKDMRYDVMNQHSYAASVPRTRFDFQMRQQTEAIQEACSKLCDVLSEMNDSSLHALKMAKKVNEPFLLYSDMVSRIGGRTEYLRKLIAVEKDSKVNVNSLLESEYKDDEETMYADAYNCGYMDAIHFIIENEIDVFEKEEVEDGQS